MDGAGKIIPKEITQIKRQIWYIFALMSVLGLKSFDNQAKIQMTPEDR